MSSLKKFDPNGASIDGSGVFGLPFKESESKVVCIPVPWEVTTSYRGGTALGPELILDCSYQVDLFDEELGDFYTKGIFFQKVDSKIVSANAKGRALAQKIIKKGGNISGNRELKKALDQVNKMSTDLNDWVFKKTKRVLDQDQLPVIVGGDHSVPLGAFKAVSEKHGDFSVLHFDAHSDTRNAYEGFKYSHASIMFNALNEVQSLKKLVQVGIRDFCEDESSFCKSQGDRVSVFTDYTLKQSEFKGIPFKETATEIASKITDKVWISFDIDGLDPVLCPGTGTPVPGGLSFAQAIEIIRTVKMLGKKIIGFDINEVSPGEGIKAGKWGQSEWNGIVGARLLYKMIGFMLATQKR